MPCSPMQCYTMLYYTHLSINIISYLLSFHLFTPPTSYIHPYLPSLSHCTYSRTYPALLHTFFIQNYIFNLKIKSSELKIFFWWKVKNIWKHRNNFQNFRIVSFLNLFNQEVETKKWKWIRKANKLSRCKIRFRDSTIFIISWVLKIKRIQRALKIKNRQRRSRIIYR